MRKNGNKNYTLYWMAGISAVLTIPIAAIIINSIKAGNIEKTAMIMGVFLALLISIMLLYKKIFRVTVQEITQDNKVTELDRLSFSLTECRKRHSNAQIRRSIDIVNDQIQRFKRRKTVLLQVMGTETGDLDGGALGDLIQSVEDVLANNIRKLINRIEIFDDQGIPDVIKESIRYIENLLFKNNEILTDFEKLITEASQMGEVQEEKDLSKLRDVINAMQSLRTDREDEIDELAKKYESK